MSQDCLSPEFASRLKNAVKQKYRTFSQNTRNQFPYPIGRESLDRLEYSAELISAIPGEITGRFAGVGNPFSIRRPRKGERVLDIGCGCGVDSFVAALQVGPEGQVVGLDLSVEMLEWALQAKTPSSLKNISFYEGSAESLPFEDASFDLVISNGALNLVPDKESAFREIARVLRPGGNFVAADLIVVDTIPEETLASMEAWST
jgi:arsenite methyltransferase